MDLVSSCERIPESSVLLFLSSSMSTGAVVMTKSDDFPMIKCFIRWTNWTVVGWVLVPPKARTLEKKFSRQSWLRWEVRRNSIPLVSLRSSYRDKRDLLLNKIPFWKGKFLDLLTPDCIVCAVWIICLTTATWSSWCTPNPHSNFFVENLRRELKTSNLKKKLKSHFNTQTTRKPFLLRWRSKAEFF